MYPSPSLFLPFLPSPVGGADGMKARMGGGADQRICELCKVSFNGRAPRTQLNEHVDSKHSKQGFDACFPGFVDPGK
jgi:hypothetical protein